MMYKYLLFFFLLWSCKKNTNNTIPAPVLETLQINYPNISKVKWEIDKHGNYEAKFKYQGKKLRADFLPNGKWIETEQNITKKQLPSAIVTRLERDFNYKKIYEIEKVHHFEKGWFYDVELKINGNKQDVEFKADGTVLN